MALLLDELEEAERERERTLDVQDVISELELEAEAERRQRYAAEEIGLLAATLEFSCGSGPGGSPRRKFICDVLNESLSRLIGLLSWTVLRIRRGGGGDGGGGGGAGAASIEAYAEAFHRMTESPGTLAGLEVLAAGLLLRLLAMDLFLSSLLCCYFKADAEQGFRNLTSLVAKLIPWAEKIFDGGTKESAVLGLNTAIGQVLECLCELQRGATSKGIAEDTQLEFLGEQLRWTLSAALGFTDPSLHAMLRDARAKLLLYGAMGRARRMDGTRHGKLRSFVARTSVVTISRCLYELRAAFRGKAFQDRYQELRLSAQQNSHAHAEMVVLTFEVQKKILPKFGFAASPKGVADMRLETGLHADLYGENMGGDGDKVVVQLRRQIHECLDMDVKKQDRVPLFHTVGDSHSCFGWPAWVIQHWQGPLLCHNVHRVDLRTLSPPLREGDGVCLCFGEIDCRCHVHKQRFARMGLAGEPQPYEEVIDDIVGRYFGHLRAQTRAGMLPAGVRIFVFNVPPPPRSCDVAEVPEFPYVGDDEDRLNYALYFNRRLKEECTKCEFIFFDVYDHYADDEGFLSADMSDGSVHIGNGTWLQEFIEASSLKPFKHSQINLSGQSLF